MTGNKNAYLCGLWLFLLAACTTTPQAPVIERLPVSKSQPAAKTAKKSAPEKDWRPENYTVKKGDTLYSIGLEYGYDYKEIAQNNNIQAPYIIRIGQQLKLQAGSKPKTSEPVTVAATTASGNDVVLTPLKTEPLVESNSASSTEPPLIAEPKALREPYTAQAATPTKVPEIAKPVAVDTPKAESAKTDTVIDDEAVDWSWPTNGKVIAGFNEASNAKGIDIAGTQGQAITASAPGKVIYSGSDLRGYGKLVIIKHNKTYLSVYAHNNQILVKEGQQVAKGQKIAEMGNTDTDRVKLHFEIRKLGKSVDPVKYLTAPPG